MSKFEEFRDDIDDVKVEVKGKWLKAKEWALSHKFHFAVGVVAFVVGVVVGSI